MSPAGVGPITEQPCEVLEAFGKGFPIGRLGRPEEVAALVAFLASPDAAYINGGDLMV